MKIVVGNIGSFNLTLLCIFMARYLNTDATLVHFFFTLNLRVRNDWFLCRPVIKIVTYHELWLQRHGKARTEFIKACQLLEKIGILCFFLDTKTVVFLTLMTSQQLPVPGRRWIIEGETLPSTDECTLRQNPENYDLHSAQVSWFYQIKCFLAVTYENIALLVSVIVDHLVWSGI